MLPYKKNLLYSRRGVDDDAMGNIFEDASTTASEDKKNTVVIKSKTQSRL